MTAGLKRMGLSVAMLRRALVVGLAGGLKVARMALGQFKIAAMATAAGLAIMTYASIRMGTSFLSAASLAEEALSKFTIVFKGVEDQAHASANAMGAELERNVGDIQSFMSRFQDIFVPMGIGREKAMEMSVAITSLGYDLTSFNDHIQKPADAMALLAGTMVGMHRNALNFGVVINKDNLELKLLEIGAKKVNGVFTEQDKMMARLLIVLDGTKDAHGNLIITYDSYKNSLEAMNAALTDVKETMGEKLLAVIKDTLKEMGGIDTVVQAITVIFAVFVAFLTTFVIPAMAEIIVKLALWTEAFGGTAEAIKTLDEAFKLFSQGIILYFGKANVALIESRMFMETFIHIISLLWNSFVILGNFLAFTFVGVIQLNTWHTTLWVKAWDKLITFLRDSAIKVLQNLLGTLADVVDGVATSILAIEAFSGKVPAGLVAAAKSAKMASAGMKKFTEIWKALPEGDTALSALLVELEDGKDKIAALQAKMMDINADAFDGIVQGTKDWAYEMTMASVKAEILQLSLKGASDEFSEGWDAISEKIEIAKQRLSQMEIVTPEQRDKQADMEAQLERLAAVWERIQLAMQNASQDFGMKDVLKGMSAGVKQFQEQVGTMEEQIANLTTDTMFAFANGMTNAFMSILDGTKSAGEAFRDFAISFLQDVSRMIMQQLILNAISGFFPAATGGVAEGGLGDMIALAKGGTVEGGLGRFMPLKGYASGGPIVNSPHVALIGEGKHNEAIVPLPDGRSIPVDLQGASETQVSINIQAVDGASVDKLLFDRRDTLRSLIASAIAESRSFRGAVARA